jgi:hypothetical protein
VVAAPTTTDPDKYVVICENERVRVLEYRDEPGQRTSPHDHLDSVMYTLSSFDRRLVAGSGESREVHLQAGEVRWLCAQTHAGENIGETPTHAVFVELREATKRADDAIGAIVVTLCLSSRVPGPLSDARPDRSGRL